MVNYKITKEFWFIHYIIVYITNLLYTELRFLYTSRFTQKNILHNDANSIMLKLNIYISLTKWSPKN
jgi:hypothetical protein